MGFFSGMCSAFSSVVSSVASTVSRAYQKGKEVAAKVLSFMADEGAQIVQTVKDVWQKAKPFLEKIQVAAKFVKKIPGMHPWILAAAEAVDRGLTALFALENSPVLQKIAAGVDWAIKTARYLNEKWLNEVELEEAEERKRAFSAAADSLNDEQRRALLFGQIVNELLMVRTKLQAQIDGAGVPSFDHYLRLRATQKLLVDVNQRVNSASELEYITADDLFLLEVGQELLASEPTLSNPQLQRLNTLIVARYRKALNPFVFEELVRGWAMSLNADQEAYEAERGRISLDEAVLQRLQANLNFELSMSPAELTQMAELKASLPAQQQALLALNRSIQHRNHFIDSAEGLMQALEGKADPDVVDMIPEVGAIIIGCMEKGQQWEQLAADEKELVIDFANIYRNARVKRGAELEAESAELVLVAVAA